MSVREYDRFAGYILRRCGRILHHLGPGAERGYTGATSGVHGWWGKAKELGSQ